MPFHFWINDNNDKAEDDGNDVPGAGTPDYNSTGVQTVRDLIDFFPVAVGAFADSGISLSFKGSAFNRIVYPASFAGITPADAGKYLSDPELAREIALMNTVSLSNGSDLSARELELIRTGKTVFLFEGTQASSEPVELVLEITMPGGTKAEVPLRVQLSSVEDMYRTHNLLLSDSSSGGLDGKTGEPTGLPDKYLDKIDFVFVPGYNVNPTKARSWNAAMFKRLFWSGSRARFHGVQWTGYQSQLFNSVTPNYHRNVINAFATAESFAAPFSHLPGERDRLVVAGHSLGNMLVSAAIQDYGLKPDAYFIINAAVAQEAYDTRDEVLKIEMMHKRWYQNGWYDNGGGGPGSGHRLWASRWHLLFEGTGDARQTLTWRGRFGAVPTSTAVHNFFSEGEEVLANHTAEAKVPSVIGYAISQIGETFKGVHGWALQEKLKGNTYTNRWGGSYYGDWGLNPQAWATRERGSKGSRRRETVGPWGSYQTDMSSEALKERPFFKPFARGLVLSGPSDVRRNLYNSNGSSFVLEENSRYDVKNRERLLAKMIPAESFSVGANSVGRFNQSGSNFHMQAEGRTDWPDGRPDSDWKHNDFRNVAYVFTKKTFDEIVNLGELKNEN